MILEAFLVMNKHKVELYISHNYPIFCITTLYVIFTILLLSVLTFWGAQLPNKAHVSYSYVLIKLCLFIHTEFVYYLWFHQLRNGAIDAEFWNSWRPRQKNRRICEKFELCMMQLTGKLNQKVCLLTKAVQHHWVVNKSFSKVKNSNKERRIRYARLRNLNNTYLIPQEDTIL